MISFYFTFRLPTLLCITLLHSLVSSHHGQFCPQYCQCTIYKAICKIDIKENENVSKFPTHISILQIESSEIQSLVLNESQYPDLKTLTVVDTVINHLTISSSKLTKFSFENVQLRNINTNISVSAKNAQTLSMINCQGFVLKNVHMPQLYRLHLRKTNVKNVTEIALFTNLAHLVLEEINLKLFNSSGLSLSKIRTLSLNHNPGITVDLTHGLPYLKQLFLVNCSLKTLENLKVEKHSQITSLDVSGNPLKHLAYHKVFRKLNMLRLNNTELTFFNSTLLGLDQLSYLYLVKSPIQVIDLKKGLGNLRTLDLSGTNILEFDSRFIHLPSLSRLIMNDIPLQKIFLGQGLDNVYALYIQNTGLSILNTSGFSLPNLKNLYMDDSAIKWLDLSSGIESVTTLYLTGIGIRSFHSYAYKLPKLRTLRLDHCHYLKHVDLTKGMENLNLLSLKNTSMTDLNSNGFTTKNLRRLYLDGTPLEKMRLIEGFDNLELLSLMNTKLTTIDSTMINAPKLEILDFEGSPIENIDLRTGFNSLEELRGGGAQLKVLHGSYLPNLHFLNLSHNPLSMLRLTKGMDKLEDLLLDHTCIDRFDESVVVAPNLERLSLRSSCVKNIDITPYPKLKRIEMEGTTSVYIQYTKDSVFYSPLINAENDSVLCDEQWRSFLSTRGYSFDMCLKNTSNNTSREFANRRTEPLEIQTTVQTRRRRWRYKLFTSKDFEKKEELGKYQNHISRSTKS